MTERIVVIPLRQGWLKKPRQARVPRAVRDIKEYVRRHFKAEDVHISQLVNERLWASGIKKPPARIKVKVSAEAGKAKVMLPDE